MNYPVFHELMLLELRAERERRLAQQMRYRLITPANPRPRSSWLFLSLLIGLMLAVLWVIPTFAQPSDPVFNHQYVDQLTATPIP
jgi:hypothetical protein